MRTAITFILLLAATPARAGNNELVIGGHARSLRSSSANAVTGDNLGGVQVGYARQLRLDLVTNLQIWATTTFTRTGVTGQTFEMETDVDVTQLSFGGRARYVLHEHLVPFARLDVGPSHTSLGLEGYAQRISDDSYGGVVTAAIGVDLFAYAHPRFSFGMRAELGYTLASSVELSPAQAASENMIELSTSQASIGHLDLGGRFFGFSALAQF